MIYGNKFYGYGVITESSINSFDSNFIIMEDMNYIDELMKSLNESYITEASFGDIIKGIFSAIGKVITKILTFVKDKLLKFLEKIKGFFDGLVNKITKMESDIDNNSSDKPVADTAYDKNVQTVANGLKDLSDAFDDLRATQMNAAQNIINAHRVADEYIKQTSEQIRKNSEEFDKQSEENDRMLKNISDILDSIDADSNFRSSNTTMTINIKSYSTSFNKFVGDYYTDAHRDLANNELQGLITDIYDAVDPDDYDEKLKSIAIKRRDEYINNTTSFIDKWSEGIKPFKSKPSSCFVIKDQKVSFLSKGNPHNPAKANKLALDQGSHMFKSASKDFAQDLKNVRIIESYLSGLKKKLDQYGEEMKSSSTNQEVVAFSKPLIASETKYCKENINICSFIIKQVMDGISTNVVAGMKFYVLAKGYIYG